MAASKLKIGDHIEVLRDDGFLPAREFSTRHGKSAVIESNPVSVTITSRQAGKRTATLSLSCSRLWMAA